MINRTSSDYILKVATCYPVVTIMGPRQSGKTTLAKALFPHHEYCNLEAEDVFADKANITEELVRLDSHIHQLKDFLKGGDESVGKKIDFLIQEMNREANTIGSKSNDKEITTMMLSLKAEIEKIREQVQNIE